MKKPAGSPTELALIERIRRDSAQRPSPHVRLGIGDDCAILRPPAGHEILVTTDLCLQGRHFRRDWHPPESVGHRCLARGLSDLAAMGAKPLAAFLSLALPADTPQKWIDGFFRGLRALADQTGVPLAGGDTAQSPSPHILADIVLIGSAPGGKALRRSGVQPGDLLFVTGKLGGAAAELLLLSENRKKPRPSAHPADHPQLFPSPRLKAGQTLLRRNLATACIDLSDGLSTDLLHLCEASGVSAELELNALPIHPLAKGRLDLALNGGEDYELLFAVNPHTRMPARIADVPVTRIGRFVPRGKGALVTAIDSDGSRSPLEPGGWQHFVSV